MKLIQACQLGCSALDGVWSFFRVFGTFGFRASHGGRECLGVVFCNWFVLLLPRPSGVLAASGTSRVCVRVPFKEL